MKNLSLTSKITQIDCDSLHKYLREISGVQLLTPEEEVELVKSIKQGSQKAKDRLVKANLRFVVAVAKQYQNKGVPLSDLINEGNIGLIKAAERFDEKQGYKFITYAVWWIRQAILAGLNDQSHTIKVPTNKILLFSQIRKAEDTWIKSKGTSPSNEDLAEVMNLSEKEIKDVLSSFKTKSSLDEPLRRKDDSTDIKEVIADPTANHHDDKFWKVEQLKNNVARILTVLNPSERNIIKMFFGINYPSQLSLEDISHQLKMSRERVRQIKEKALKKLKYHSVRKKIHAMVA